MFAPMSDEIAPLLDLRRERERAIELLSEAFASDLLDVDQFEERVGRAHRAREVGELSALVRDLRAPPGGAAHAALSSEERTALAAARPRSRNVVALMGGADRAGQWLLPEYLRVFACMGGATLDLREAVLPPGVTTVQVIALMGGVEIIVPPDLAVDCEGAGILGGFEAMNRTPILPDPDAPLLRVTGVAIMGGFEISTRLPGESARQAKKRRRREQKEQLRIAEKSRQDQLGDGR